MGPKAYWSEQSEAPDSYGSSRWYKDNNIGSGASRQLPSFSGYTILLE